MEVQANWYDRLDLSRISDDLRFKIFNYLVAKYGRDRVREALGVSRYTIYRMMKRQITITDGNLRKLLSLISEDEFRQVAGSMQLLQARGVIREDGLVDYSTVLEILAVACRDEYLKQAVIRFAVENFKEDLRKALGVHYESVVFKWTRDFEYFLRKEKKPRPVRDEETLRKYRGLFRNHLEGKTLSEELVDYVRNYKDQQLRNIFRAYIKYLYFKRKISGETLGWLLVAVPAREWRRRPTEEPLDIEKLVLTVNTLKGLSESNPARYLYHYVAYGIMYFSGCRIKHVAQMIATYNPDETVVIKTVRQAIHTKRLVVKNNFCRYYLGLRSEEGHKECEWIYFPKELLEPLNNVAGIKRSRWLITRIASRRKLAVPSLYRKLHWRVMERLAIKHNIPLDVPCFIQSRFGEIPVSGARYGQLLTDSDSFYPTVMKVLKKGLEDYTVIDKLLKEPLIPEHLT